MSLTSITKCCTNSFRTNCVVQPLDLQAEFEDNNS
uniref:Uncharacterized protein n=1 Tax=Lepeophtheirus salmonis TaxID=72036 RepID=A0A0K2V1B1_LEPSM